MVKQGCVPELGVGLGRGSLAKEGWFEGSTGCVEMGEGRLQLVF